MTVSPPPNGWSVSPLIELVATDAPIGYGIVQPGPDVADGIPMIAVRDMLKVVPERLHRASPAIEGNYRRSRVEPSDILISVKGTTGRVGIVPDGLKANISRDVARLRFRADQSAEFWFQLLRSEEAQKRLSQAGVGSTRQELSIGILKHLEFAYPRYEEQVEIAQRLADTDRLIGGLVQLITKKRDIKLGLMKELLTGRTRLPGFTSEWREARVDELTTIIKGQQLGRAHMVESGSVEVWNGGVEPSGFTDHANVNSVVVTVSEGGNSCGWVGRPQSGFWLGGHCYALAPRPQQANANFLYQALKARESDIMALRVGSGLPNIQKRALSGFVVSVPDDPAEAVVLAELLGDADLEIDILVRRLDSARTVKQGMMQELLTGRTRLVAEGVAA